MDTDNQYVEGLFKQIPEDSTREDARAYLFDGLAHLFNGSSERVRIDLLGLVGVLRGTRRYREWDRDIESHLMGVDPQTVDSEMLRRLRNIGRYVTERMTNSKLKYPTESQ